MTEAKKKFMIALTAASGVGIVLFLLGVVRNATLDYWYLLFNFGLALIPLLLSLLIKRLLPKFHWNNWRVLSTALLWLLFLPNSFYIVTDIIHLPETQRVDIMQDVAMLLQFSVLGLVLGFSSLFMIHKAYLKELSSGVVASLVIVVLFLSSFAIYLGRDLRWNSWDAILHPLAMSRDILERVVFPLSHPRALMTTATYFIVLTSLYAVLWYGIRAIQQKG